MKTKIKFIKTKDAAVAARLIEEGLTCYCKNDDGEWYFKYLPTVTFSNEEKSKVAYTCIMNV